MSESARISKLLERQRLLQCAAAIQGARAEKCFCDLPTNTVVAPSIAACCKTPSDSATTFTGGTGNVASSTLTVTAVSSGALSVGMVFSYGGTYTAPNGNVINYPLILNRIIAFGTGVGGIGTYTIGPQTIPDGSIITSTNNNTIVPALNSRIEAEKADPAVWGALVFPGAVAIRGRTVVAESARLKAKTDKYLRPQDASYRTAECGYFPPGIPFIAPGCPPTPTAILNGSLPKPSTRVVCPVTRFQGAETVCSD